MNAEREQAGGGIRFPIRTYDLRLRWWLSALAAAAVFALVGFLTGWNEDFILLHFVLGLVCCGLLVVCLSEFVRFLSGYIVLEPGGILYGKRYDKKRRREWQDIGCILLLSGFSFYPVNGLAGKLPSYGSRDPETGRIWNAPSICLMARAVDFGEEMAALRQRRAGFIRLMILVVDREYNPCRNLLRRIGRKSFLRLDYREDLMNALLTRIDCPVLCTTKTFGIYRQWLWRYTDNPRLIRVEERDSCYDKLRGNVHYHDT